MYSYSTVAVLLIAAMFKIGRMQTIDPNSVDEITKEKWCNDQKSACPLLCKQIPGASQKPQQNDCTPESLVYICVCSNGLQPNSSEYSLTIPFHECQEFGNQCVKKCNVGDSNCQAACRTNNPCGAQHPKQINITSSTTMAATSTEGSVTSKSGSSSTNYGNFGVEPTASSQSGSSGSSDQNSAQALAIGFGRTYGLVLILAVVFGGFTIML